MSGNIIENFKQGINMIETSLSEEQTLFGYIKLKYEVNNKHFLAMLAFHLVLGLCIFGAELQQQNSLLNLDYFSLKDADTATDYNAWLILVDLLTKLIVTPIYKKIGYNLGRRKMAFIGFGVVAVSFLIFRPSPQPDTSFSFALVSRFVYANGIAVLLSLPLLSDYIEHDSKGRGIGLNALFLTLGYFLASYIVNLFSYYDDLTRVYMTYFVIVLLLGNTASWFLKSGIDYFRQAVLSPDKHIDVDEDINKNPLNPSEDQIILSKRKLALHACKARPWIYIAFVFSFMTGLTFAVTAQNLNLYSQTFRLPGKLQTGSSITMKANFASALVSLILGPTIDKIQPLYLAIVTFVLAILGSFSIWTVEDPHGSALTVLGIALGMAYGLSRILNIYLGYKHYPTSMRGLFFTFSSFFVALGVFCTTVIGGLFMDTEDKNWPFYMTGLCSVIGLAVFTFVYVEIIIPTKRKIKNKQELNLSLLYTSIQSKNVNEVTIELDNDNESKLHLEN